jgi:hypothetical protein
MEQHLFFYDGENPLRRLFPFLMTFVEYLHGRDQPSDCKSKAVTCLLLFWKNVAAENYGGVSAKPNDRATQQAIR